ncbi:hypothetical protein BX666DRAFT_269211 [Dichotomocladium elegans]|nr:hypothetical protein BX666DRAFT_269211 [Dichotomocladium elegans]
MHMAASTNSVNNLNKKPKDKLASGSKRQIRVRSIGEDYSVWIDISPKETGSTLAEKIHIIASRKTKKVASVTTAAGRKISLDRRPLFDGWDDLQKFQSGEEWQVEWCEQDRRLVDRLLSKVV